MFSTFGAPSAMLRSPSESPIRMMLQYSFSCLKYSVFRRAPSCLLYTWISSPLKPFKTPCEMKSTANEQVEPVYFYWSHQEKRTEPSVFLCRTHIIIKVHEVGDDLDVGVVDSSLADDFFEDVAQASREDEDRHVMLLQAIKELLKAFPETKQRKVGHREISLSSNTAHWIHTFRPVANLHYQASSSSTNT